jgi:hypothetical protein
MSYENPITVVDTESAKIRAAGMASFGQSVGGAITALGQRQRQEAKERKEANLAEANAVVKYNDAYQSNIFSSTDKFKEDSDFDISPQITGIFNTWADEGARLKARRDATDSPEERRELQKQIAVYDKFFLGGGMTSSLGAISELQAAIAEGGAPNKLGRIGGLSASDLDPKLYKDFIGLAQGNGGKGMSLKGISPVYDEKTGTYSALSLETIFNGGGSYNTDQLSKGELVYIPDMQEGTQDVLKKQGLINDRNAIDPNSKQFLDNFAKKENGKIVYSTRTDVNGNEIRYIDIDFDRFKNYLDGTYNASITGYSAGAGDETSMGYREMQSYVNDILDDIPADQQEEFKKLTGFGVDDLVLEIGNHENTILSEESYNNFQNALSAQKYLEIKNRVPGTMVQKPKTLSASDRKAIQEANTQEKIDNKLNLVIESAMMNEEGSDIGIYNYLNDSQNAEGVGYTAKENKRFQSDLIPKNEVAEYLKTMDAEKFKEFYPDLKQANEEDLQSIVNDMGDSNFMSVADERPMEALNEMDAYNFMLQDIPMFSQESTVKLAKARGDFKMSDKYLDPKIDKKARQQLGSPEEYVSRKMAETPLQDPNKLKLKYLDELQKLKAKLKANK